MARGHWRVGKKECNFCGTIPCYRVKGSKEAWFLCTKCAIRNNHEIEQPTPPEESVINVVHLAAGKPIPEWEDRFKKTKFAMGGGLSFECSDYEGMYDDLLDFIRDLLKQQRSEVAREIKEKLKVHEWINHLEGDYSSTERSYLEGQNNITYRVIKFLEEYLKENEE